MQFVQLFLHKTIDKQNKVCYNKYVKRLREQPHNTMTKRKEVNNYDKH